LPNICAACSRNGGDGDKIVFKNGADCVAPLLAAVHVAFAQHRPLVLAPDAVWLTS
jgi:hypothetical protein